MVVVFTITEINYLVVSLFFDLVRVILYLYLWYKVLWLRYLPCFWHSNKIDYAFAQCHSLHSKRSPSGRVVFKQNILSKFGFTNCFVYDSTLIFFLKLGLCYNSL